MTTKFVTDEFERAIKTNIVQKTFPRLVQNQIEMLASYLYGILQMLATCHDFYNDRDNFNLKLKQNSYKDLRWILTYLLPYIDQTKKSTSELTDLEQLYSLRYDQVSSDIKALAYEKHVDDINIVPPKYVFSNIQYGRFIRGSYSDGGAKCINFSEKHIKDNYYLLLDTIKTTRYKLYINWIDILPYRMDTYDKTSLYVSTIKKFNENEFSLFDTVTDYPYEKRSDIAQIQILNNKLSGLNVEDIYNTISLDLYESILKYKWLIFDVGVKLASGKPYVTPLVFLLSSIIGLNHIMNEIPWDKLTLSAQERFAREWDRFILAYEQKLQMGNSSGVIVFGSVRTIMKSIVVFFDRKYSKIESLIKKEKYIPLNKREIQREVDDYDERMRDVTDEAVLKTVKSIDYIYMYDFLFECLQGFKTTWYSHHILSQDKKSIGDTEGYKKVDADAFITFKNIYNFCK
jgi:hypothetical protein